jgi:transcription elongation factor Elf1
MADEVIFRVWCDVHQKEYDTKVEGQKYNVLVQEIGGQPLARRLDLCSECYENFLGPVVTRLEAYGARDDAKGITWPMLPSTNGGSGSSTGKPAKGAPSEDPVRPNREFRKTTDPLSPLDIVKHDKRYECPFCPNLYVSRTTLYSHSKNVHGFDIANQSPAGADLAELTCPECQAQGKTMVAAGKQGLGAHRRVKHGVVGTDKAA